MFWWKFLLKYTQTHVLESSFKLKRFHCARTDNVYISMPACGAPLVRSGTRGPSPVKYFENRHMAFAVSVYIKLTHSTNQSIKRAPQNIWYWEILHIKGPCQISNYHMNYTKWKWILRNGNKTLILFDFLNLRLQALK